MKVSIAPDFEHLLPPLSAEELHQLEANCKADPKHERMPPVVVWKNHKNTIVDGHNQHRIRDRARLKIKYVGVEFETRDEAKQYALDVQFGRRNLGVSQRAIAYAQLPRKVEGKPSANSANLQSIEELAEKAGVSERTMSDAAKVVDNAPAAVVKAVAEGKANVSDAASVADRPKAEQAKLLKAVEDGKAPTMRRAAKISGGTSFDTDELEGKKQPEPGLKDKRDVAVPEKLRPAFKEGKARLRSFTKRAGDLLSEIEQATNDQPGCERIPLAEVRDSIKNLQAAISASTPTYVCTCKGRGCKRCSNLGWLHKHCGVAFDE